MTWETLWAVGRYDLRLGEDEFWRLVPRQFVELLRRQKDEILREEFGPALIASTIWHVNGKKFPLTMFMPSYKAPKKKEKSDAEIMAVCKQLNLALGGKPWPSQVSQ